MRVGFIGVGAMAMEHAQAVRAAGDSIAFGTARSPQSPRWLRFSERNPEARFCGSIGEILADPTMDAYIAALPWNEMEAQLPRLLADPRPMLLEKPVALSSAALQKTLDGGSKSGTSKKFVAFNRRFYPHVQKVRERIELGGLCSAEVLYGETVARLSAKYGEQIESSLYLYSAVHILDLLFHLLGPAAPIYKKSVSRTGARYSGTIAMLETQAGVPVTITCLAEMAESASLSLRFDDGSVWKLSPLERLQAFQGMAVREPGPQNPSRRYEPECVLEMVPDATDLKLGLAEQWQAFRGVSSGSERSRSLCDLSEALRLSRWIESFASTAARS